MTKEPKLQSAMRIVKEWPDYDNEARRLQESLASKMAATKSEKDKPTGKWRRDYLRSVSRGKCHSFKNLLIQTQFE